MNPRNLIVLTRFPNEEFKSKLMRAASNNSIKAYLLHPNEIDLPLEKYLHLNKHLPAPEETLLWNRVSGTSYDDYDQLICESWQQLGLNH